jgi:hypothetical protein
MPGPRHDCVAMSLRTHRVIRLPAVWSSRVVRGVDLVACSAGQMLHVFRVKEGRFESVTVALPESANPAEISIAGSRIVAVWARVLVVLDADALPFAEPHASLPLTLVQREARGEKLEGPANVAFLLSDKVLVDHPVKKRLTLPRTPTSPLVVKGDEVLIDDLREELVGDPRVHAWRKVGDAEPGLPEAETMMLEARPLPVLDASPQGPAQAPLTNRIRLEKQADEHGFRVPPRLLRLLALHDEEPVMRRLLGKLGMDAIEVRDLVRDWDADPCLIAFSGRGNGDEVCLYVYPPEARAEPPIVEFFHEDNLIEPRALRFDDWLSNELDAVSEEVPDLAPIAQRVREALGLAQAETIDVDAITWPSWLDAARGVGAFKNAKECDAKARSLVASGHFAEAERWLLRAYLASDGQGGTRTLLARVYGELGWSLPSAHLASRDD